MAAGGYYFGGAYMQQLLGRLNDEQAQVAQARAEAAAAARREAVARQESAVAAQRVAQAEEELRRWEGIYRLALRGATEGNPFTYLPFPGRGGNVVPSGGNPR